MLRFDGEVAVVTGAGRGLGAAYARLLAGRGCGVLVNDLHGDPAGEVVADIVENGGRAVVDHGDVTTDADAIIDHAMEAFGRVDLVINNAGILARNPFTSITPDQLTTALRVHVIGSFAVTRAAWPQLQAAPAGRVAFTSSGGAFGIPGSLAYVTAKSAIIGLTKTLALEARADGIRVNALMPAGHTRMSAGTPGTDTETLMERFFPPALVAPFVAWLMHSSTDVTGETFTVGGGRAARVFLAEAAGAVAASASPEVWEEHKEQVLETETFAVPASAFDELRWAVDHLDDSAVEAFKALFPVD